MISEHYNYLKYLIRHKWYVAIECFKRGLYLLAFTHDISKFRPSEWFPYVEYFYGKWDRDEPDEIKVQIPFDGAWLKHQHRNKHHWQYWVLVEDEGQIKSLPIPDRIIIEMACDWIGASKAIRGKDANAWDWYQKVKDRTLLSNKTREKFELYLNQKVD